MLTLFHQPLCPHSRFVRLVLGEYGLATRLVEERFWERREEFLVLNPAGTIPVLVEEGQPPVPGAAIIAEYLDETRGAEPADRGCCRASRRSASRCGGSRAGSTTSFTARSAARWSTSACYKRYMTLEQGGGPPDTDAIRAARHNIRYHLAYIGWLVRTRNFLAGDRLSYADLAAAAHLSAADYLGDVPWSEDDAAKNWYARVKSRPSFRPLLAETLAGIPPSKSYGDLDF